MTETTEGKKIQSRILGTAKDNENPNGHGIDIDADAGTVTFHFVSGESPVYSTDQLPDGITNTLIVHGLKQKLADGYAGCDGDVDVASAGVASLFNQLLEGIWGKTTGSSGGKLAKAVWMYGSGKDVPAKIAKQYGDSIGTKGEDYSLADAIEWLKSIPATKKEAKDNGDENAVTHNDVKKADGIREILAHLTVEKTSNVNVAGML